MQRILLLFILFISSLQAMANGTISGKITDQTTGEALIGVTVMIPKTTYGTATDVEGRFSISVPEGNYTVEVKYLGYTGKSISDVIVKNGQNAEVNIVMGEAKESALEEVVVTATLKKESVNTLYAMQKNNVAVSSGISADLIRRSPDRNTGEVIKRVSGASVRDNKFVIIRGLSERYNAAMINNALMPSSEPDRKAFSFDVIPSNLIDNIVINKTASPDLPGDFAGGVIQVVTKDIPDRKFLNLNLGLGYNTQSTGKDFLSNGYSFGNYLGFADKKQDLPASFGANRTEYLSMSNEQRNEAARQLNNNYVVENNQALPNMNLQLSAGTSFRTKGNGKVGLVGAVAYRNSSTLIPEYLRSTFETDRMYRFNTDGAYRFQSGLSGLANISYAKGKSKFAFKNFYNKMFDNLYYERSGYSVGSLQDIKLYSAIPNDRQTMNTQIEGEHAFGARNIKLYWNLNYSNLDAKQHDLRTAFYSRNISFDNQNNPVYNDALPYELVDRNSRRFFADMKDNNYGGNIHAIVPFQLFDQKQTIKVGYLALMKNRDFQSRMFQYQPSLSFDPSIAQLPLNEIFEPQNINDNGYGLDEITNPQDKYEVKSMLHAGFMMFDNQLSEQWRLTWGVRVESYSQNLKTLNLSNQQIDKTDVFTDILPSVNLSYNLNDKSKLRLSGSQTVNRPEFRELAPFTFTDFENFWEIKGNPDLKRGRILNADVRYEYYPGAGEAITIGAFYKYFRDPIENRLDDQSNLDLFIFSFSNAKAATSAGAEIEVRKNLSFISSAQWLENIIVGANLTYVHSKVDLSNIGGLEDRPLQGQSPYIINLSVLYNEPKTGIAFSALYNRIGERIFIVGNKTIPTTWENGRDQLDLQLSKSLLKNKAEIKLNVSNLLNQPVVYYWNTDNKNAYKSGDSPIGIGNDQIFQRYRLGTTFTLGFSYNF